jgi:hypothetical protein
MIFALKMADIAEGVPRGARDHRAAARFNQDEAARANTRMPAIMGETRAPGAPRAADHDVK